MQKRARAVDTKMRRTMKRGNRQIDPVKDSVSMSLAYMRLLLMWVSLIGLEAAFGLRFELLWPFWLIMRSGYEAMNKSQGSVVTLANHNTAKFSVLFVCVTATSDLICYLFIPVRILVVLSSTYVWIHLIWHTHNGVVRSITSVAGERAQAIPLVLLWMLVFYFEFSCRIRNRLADLPSVMWHALTTRSASGFSIFLVDITDFKGCPSLHSSTIPRGMNAFFGAHCLGYPIVLIGFSLKYYMREWRLRKKQGEVSSSNEHLNRLLVEALPAQYDGPKDFSKPCLEEECFLLDSGSAIVPALPAPVQNGISLNGAVKKNGLPKYQSSRQKTAKPRSVNGNASQTTPPTEKKRGDHKRSDEGDDDDSEDDFGWKESTTSAVGHSRTPGSVSIVRIAWEMAVWLTGVISTFSGRRSLQNCEEGGSIYGDDDDDDSLLIDDRKRNGDAKNRQAMMLGAAGGRQRNKIKQQTKEKFPQLQPEKTAVVTPLSNGHRPAVNLPTNSLGNSSMSTRDSSHDLLAASENNNDPAGLALEIEKLRNEINHLKLAEADARIQLSIYEGNEKAARQEAAQMRSRVEQVEAKYATMEKLREVDRSSLAQLEKKYADLLNRKNDIERELMSERKARKEDGGKRLDSNELQREKERVLEREVDNLRAEARVREEKSLETENELQQLRKYKEMNDIDELNMELRIQKEKLSHLEASLASENKLKQELFRALGDARANNAVLEHRISEMEDEFTISPHHHLQHDNLANLEHQNGTQQTQQQKQPLHINMTRQCSPFGEKVSPIPSTPTPQLHNVPAPPPYQMVVQQPKTAETALNYLYTALQQHHSSPTGEHLLFDAPQPPTPSSTGMTSSCSVMSPHEIIASRMGKFGAPSNPARSN
ncbi:unnamed protein product [Caenorhabditis auriculariae]|uniref:Macoilin n=1 Tax=Caenorhabditis auriculariae TaxID=2777116 RepID=A0A8S1HHW4_9PELO|nr:unnamed protein product [Caenorhabditis auriculariae]